MRVAPPVTVLLALAVSSATTADTIVLKNGRRITAENVTEDATRVTYLTPAGELSIPRSIVERIDHDGFKYPRHQPTILSRWFRPRQSSLFVDLKTLQHWLFMVMQLIMPTWRT